MYVREAAFAIKFKCILEKRPLLNEEGAALGSGDIFGLCLRSDPLNLFSFPVLY